MKTLLAVMMVVTAVALAWGRSEHERARYFAVQAEYSELDYLESEACRAQGVAICFVDLPPGE